MRSERLRVGQFLSHFPAGGGSTTVLRGLASGLAELGHEVVAYGYGPGDGANGSTDLESMILGQPRLRARPLSRVPLRDELATRIAANVDRLDILIVHGMWSPYSTGLRRAARSAGIPCIAQPHDPYSPAVFASAHLRKTAYWRLVERPFLRSVDAVQVYAPSHRAHLERLDVSVPSFVVPAGLDARLLERVAADRRDATTIDGSLRLVFLGRFDVYNKGIDILLDALASDSKLRSHLRLDVVGGRTPKELRIVQGLVSRRGLDNVVSVHRRRDDPFGLLREADLLVLPSRFDGFAQVVTEALAVGTPVIVSTEAGSSEFVGPAHGAVPAAPVASQLQRVLADARVRLPELRAAARRAHEYLRRELTWVPCAERWLEGVYCIGLVGRPARGSSDRRMAVGRA